MNKFFHQIKRADTWKPGNGFSAILKIITNIARQITSLLYLTEEEQKDAGIYYPGDQRSR